MDAMRSSETSIVTKATRDHISEEGIFHSHGRENLKSHMINGDHSTQQQAVISAQLSITYTLSRQRQ
jgi:hypothetical protein